MQTHVCARTHTPTQEEGKAKHVMPHCPSVHTRRPPGIRQTPCLASTVVSQLHSCSSETKALIYSQDTGQHQHSFAATSVPQAHCSVDAGTSLKMRSSEVCTTPSFHLLQTMVPYP